MRGACNSGIAVCGSAEHYGVYAQDVWKNGEPSLVNHYIHNNSLIKILDIWGTLANYSQHVQPNYPFGWIFYICSLNSTAISKLSPANISFQ